MIPRKKSQVFTTLLFLADQFILWACWSLAYATRFEYFSFPPAPSTPPFWAYFRISWVVVVLGSVSFFYAQMYHPKRLFHYGGGTGATLKGMVFLSVALLGSSFFYREFSFSRVFALHFIIEAFIGIYSFRVFVRWFLAYLRRKGRNIRRVLVIGQGHTAELLSQKLKANPELGLIPVGYLGMGENPNLGLSYLGSYAELSGVIAQKAVDQVYLALDSDQQSDLGKLNHQLAIETVDLHFVPDIYQSLSINPEVLDFDGMPVLALRQSPVDGWNQVLKRAFDLGVAACSILAVFPLWILIPLLIKLTSKGPVFYRQTRMGLDGKPFGMLKFRSMRTDAEAATGAVWATKGDQRVTPIGQFLRRTSLDEIPQLFNVISGDMSIVGPRPERPELIKDFKNQIPNYMLRHKIKAGLTGWAQINGWRGNTSLEKRIEYDIYYLTHWSIWFDLKIFLLSLFKGFVDPNAY